MACEVIGNVFTLALSSERRGLYSEQGDHPYETEDIRVHKLRGRE